jgi:predicted RNase H-like HicB family nuclease
MLSLNKWFNVFALSLLWIIFVCRIYRVMNSFELTAIYEPCDEGGFIAYIEEIPGINSQGDSIEEAKENLADAINLMFAEIRASQTHKDKIKIKNLITQTLTFTL